MMRARPRDYPEEGGAGGGGGGTEIRKLTGQLTAASLRFRFDCRRSILSAFRRFFGSFSLAQARATKKFVVEGKDEV